MGSILKTVSTPIKWVFKQGLNKTLLRFPGGDAHDPIACTYCPEMCRFSCPTAVVSGNDAVTPLNKNSLLHKERQWPGRMGAGGPLWTIFDCTGCGRCTEYCVYEMPITDHLFGARGEGRFRWDRAVEAAAVLTDAEDPAGDLAFELGDKATAERRLTGFAAGFPEQILKVDEPKVLAHVRKGGYRGELSWETAIRRMDLLDLQEKLEGKRWLVHESVWLNRHLERAEEIQAWVASAIQQDIELVVPFAHGRDCIDCGGEGAYPRLFPGQAEQMAREFWERDRHRADGILCFSPRCVEHLRKSLGSEVPVLFLGDLRGGIR